MRAIQKKQNQIIITEGGFHVPLSDCKKFLGKYYSIEKECVLINNKWYLKSDERVIYDNFLKKWTRNARLNFGIIDCQDGEFVMGHFSPSIYDNCDVQTYQVIEETGALVKELKQICMSIEIMRNLPEWTEVYQDSKVTFFLKAVCVKKYIHPFEKHKFSFEKQAYNIEECLDYQEKQNSFDNYPLPIENSVRKIKPLIANYTFGVEIETIRGILPTLYQHRLGIVICKDGSIAYSPEYTSIPYDGVKGIQAMKNLFIELEKRCTVDVSCSLHYHIGNIRKDREFLLAFYKFAYEVQEELFAMLPYYKTEHYDFKQKNYNCQLKNIISLYNERKDLSYTNYIGTQYNILFEMLNEGMKACKESNRRNQKHSNGVAKWNRHARYDYVNFINMFFSNRQTIEFRLHSATLNPTKALNWFFICLAQIKFVEKHSNKILTDRTFKYDMESVLKDVYPDNSLNPMASYLHAYILNRKEFHSKCKEKQDWLSRAEEKEDEKGFSFLYQGKNSVV